MINIKVKTAKTKQPAMEKQMVVPVSISLHDLLYFGINQRRTNEMMLFFILQKRGTEMTYRSKMDPSRRLLGKYFDETKPIGVWIIDKQNKKLLIK